MVLTINLDRERAGACTRLNVTIPWGEPSGFYFDHPIHSTLHALQSLETVRIIEGKV